MIEIVNTTNMIEVFALEEDERLWQIERKKRSQKNKKNKEQN